MKKILDIPHYSQFSESIEKDWRERSCAIACLKMIFDFYGEKTEIMDLIKEGTLISQDLTKAGKPHEGYSSATGWGHGVLVMILRNHNVPAYSQEFRAVNVDIESGKMNDSENGKNLFKVGLNKIEKNITDGVPVIVSIRKSFTEKNSHHMVVIVGYEKNEKGEYTGFFYNDPEPKGDDGKNFFVDIEKFKEGWKKLAIFTEK